MLIRIFILGLLLSARCFATFQWTAPTTVASGTSYTVTVVEVPGSGYPGSGSVVLKKNEAFFASGLPSASTSTTDNVSVQTVITYKAVGWSGAISTWNVTITPPAAPNNPPLGAFDVVTPNPIEKGSTITMMGWAADPDQGAPVSSVKLLIDGTLSGSAQVINSSRPDVASVYGRADYQNSGWTYTVSTVSLTAGTHTVQAVAYDNKQATTTIGSKTFTVTNGKPTSTISLNKPAGIPLGWKVSITATSSDLGSDLVGNTVEYLAPGASAWVAATPNWGDGGAATKWTGTATSSNTLTVPFTPTLAGTYQFRCQGLDATNQSGNYAITSFVVAPSSESTDFDGDGMNDKWEMQYGLDPTNPSDANSDADGDGYTNIEEYNRWMTPNVSDAPANTPSSDIVTINLSVLGKGTGSVTMVINGVSTVCNLTAAAGVWDISKRVDGRVEGQGVSIKAHEENTIQVSSVGVSDFIIKASINTNEVSLYGLKPMFDGRYIDGISKQQITAQGGITKLNVAREKKVPFGVVDTSRIELNGDILFGLGESRTGRSPGLLIWDGGNVYFEQGPATAQLWRTHTRLQGAVPGGYFDINFTRQKTIIKYYPNAAYSILNGLNDFSSTTPLATYEVQRSNGSVAYGAVCPTNTSLTNVSSVTSIIRRWVGSTPYVLEIEKNYYRGLGLGYSWVSNPTYGYIETYADVFRNVNNIWMWRREDPAVSKAGLTTIEYESVQPVQRFGSSGSPNRSFQTILYWKRKYLGDTNAATLGYYETRTYGGTDFKLAGNPGITKGNGSDAIYAVQSSKYRLYTGSGTTALGNNVRVDWTQQKKPGESSYTGVVIHEPLTFGDVNLGIPNNMSGYPAIAVDEERFSRASFGDSEIGSASDIITTSMYGGEPVDGRVEPTSVVSKQGSLEIERKEFLFSQATISGLPIIRKSKKEYVQSGTYLLSVESYYSKLLADQDIRGKLLSKIAPDNTKTCYAYVRGNLVGGSWTSNASGDYLLWVEILGKDGTGLSKYQGSSGAMNLDIDTISLDDSRSTAVEKIVDAQGRLQREQTLYFKNTNWIVLSSIYYGYDNLGNLVYKGEQPVGSPQIGRIFYQAAFQNFRQLWEINEQGVKTSFENDDYDRVSKVHTVSATYLGNQIPEIILSYGYDPLGRKLSEKTQSVSGGEELIAEFSYDTANRMTSKSAPGVGAAITSYDTSTKTTTTNADQGTVVTEVYADGRKKATSGTAVPDVSYAYSYEAVTGFLRTTETFSTGKYSTTVTDWLGRVVRKEYPTFSGSVRTVTTSYNTLGQLVKESTTSNGVRLLYDHLYEYDSFGHLKREAYDGDSNGVISVASDFDIKAYEHSFVVGAGSDSVNVYSYKGTLVWPYDGTNSGVSRYLTQEFSQITGLASNSLSHILTYDFDRNSTESTETVVLSSAAVTKTTTQSGSAMAAAETLVNGRKTRSVNFQGQVSLFTYDNLGRLSTSNDPRIGTTSLLYQFGTTFVSSTTTPDARTNSASYDTMGRVYSRTNPAARSDYFRYDAAGNLTYQWGETVNPVRFEFNDLNQQIALHTYRNGTWNTSAFPSGFSGVGDLTTWGFNPATGLMIRKSDAAGVSFQFEYNDLDLKSKRTDGRNWVTKYGYNLRGLPSLVDYTDGFTSDISYTYDRVGRLKTVTDAAGVRSFDYFDSWSDSVYDHELRNKSGRLADEVLPAYFGSHVINHDYQYGISSQINGAESEISFDTGSLYKVHYTYDNLLRLSTIAYNNSAPFLYSYATNSNLVDSIGQLVGANSYSFKRQFGYRPDGNVISTIDQSWYGSSITSSRSSYDTVGFRSSDDIQGTAYMTAIGRSTDPGVGSKYGYNSRNELESSWKMRVEANWTETTQRAGSVVGLTYDAIGNRSTSTGSFNPGSFGTNSLNQYNAAPGVASFTYDNNGNMTGDGVKTYQYDGENQLIGITQGTSNWSYKYDYLGRRISKSGTGISERRFIYDGWNLLAELDNVGSISRRFVWGPDVTGTFQGMGGVGGLLMIDVDGSNRNTILYDSSANVIGLVSSTGSLVAAYEYDPFGRAITASGSYALQNPFRFSTKYTDDESSLVYYGLRFFSPSLGRFINRDPIGEAGGLNLYGFCGNNAVNRWDKNGQMWDWLAGLLGALGFDSVNHSALSNGNAVENPENKPKEAKDEKIHRTWLEIHVQGYADDLNGPPDANSQQVDPNADSKDKVKKSSEDETKEKVKEGQDKGQVSKDTDADTNGSNGKPGSVVTLTAGTGGTIGGLVGMGAFAHSEVNLGLSVKWRTVLKNPLDSVVMSVSSQAAVLTKGAGATATLGLQVGGNVSNSLPSTIFQQMASGAKTLGVWEQSAHFEGGGAWFSGYSVSADFSDGSGGANVGVGPEVGFSVYAAYGDATNVTYSVSLREFVNGLLINAGFSPSLPDPEPN